MSGGRRRAANLLAAGLSALAAAGALFFRTGSERQIFELEALGVMGPASAFKAKAAFRARDARRAQIALQAALDAARALERKISRFDERSEVRRLAALPPGREMEVSPEVFDALALSKDLWRRSGGAFDCTVGPLLRLYRFSGREEEPPSDAEVAAARARVGSEKLLLDAGRQRAALAAAGMEVDLGAVGQGLAADIACEALRRHGALSALVEVGGEVRALGQKRPGQPWKVDIQHPRAARDTPMATMEISGGAVSTSGDYEKHFKEGGRRASHIVDPRTGRPLVGGAVSVTIIAPSCVLADGLATAVSVLGPAAGLKLVEGYRAEGLAVEALIIEEVAGGELVPHLSSGLAGKLQLNLGVPAAGGGGAARGAAGGGHQR